MRLFSIQRPVGTGTVTVSGSGTANRLVKFAGATSIQNSNWSEVGGNILSLGNGQTISVPGVGGVGSEQFGLSSFAGASLSTALGYVAGCAGGSDICVGAASQTSSYGSIAIGASAEVGSGGPGLALGYFCVVGDGANYINAIGNALQVIVSGTMAYGVFIGDNSTITSTSGSGTQYSSSVGYGNVLDGSKFAVFGSNNVVGADNAILVGTGNTTTRSAIIIGHNVTPTNADQCWIASDLVSAGSLEFFFGAYNNSAANPQFIGPTPVDGSDVAGNDVHWRAGQSTGSGKGGIHFFDVSTQGSPGSAINSYTNAARLSYTYGWTWLGKMDAYNNITCVSNGIASAYAQSALVNQSAAIAATTIYAVPSQGNGLYRISFVATVTRAASTSSVLGGANGFKIIWTDHNDSVVKTSAKITDFTSAGNTTGTTVSGSLYAFCAQSTNLQYSFDYTSVGITTMQYDLTVTVEKV